MSASSFPVAVKTIDPSIQPPGKVCNTAAHDFPIILRDVEAAIRPRSNPQCAPSRNAITISSLASALSRRPFSKRREGLPEDQLRDRGRRDRLPNVASIIFKEHEGSFLVGMIAAGTSKTGTIGFIGGMDIPLIHKFEVGYEEGARFVNPRINIIPNYIGVTEAAGRIRQRKELARTQIGKERTFFYGGRKLRAGRFRCGGTIRQGPRRTCSEICDRRGFESELGKAGFVLTSMVKRVDNAVYQTVKDRVHNQPVGGIHVYGLDNDGVSYAADQYNKDLLSPSMLQKVEDARKQIIAGELKVTDVMAK